MEIPRAFAVAAYTVAAILVSPPATHAQDVVSSVAGAGEWATPFAGSSSCANVGAVGISCSHAYTSLDVVTGVDSCFGAATIDAGRPSVTIVNPCHATLSGVTTGTGRAVGENAGVCVTAGFLTGTVTFSDSTGAPYPAISVTIVNDGGAASFAGSYANASDVVVAMTKGTFSMGCGGPAGSFAGTYTLL